MSAVERAAEVLHEFIYGEAADSVGDNELVMFAQALADAGLLSDSDSRDVLDAELAVLEAAKAWNALYHRDVYSVLVDENLAQAIDALLKAEAQT